MTTTPNDPGETTTVRLPRQLVEQVRQLAQDHDRSLSAELRVAVAHYVRVHEPTAKRPRRKRAPKPKPTPPGVKPLPKPPSMREEKS